MREPFRFKQFEIFDDQCQMKVGTDGVLLGAFAEVNSATSILDIGTGSGLIAIMLAQKSQAKIIGIDIENESIIQAKENGLLSPWSERLTFHNISIQDFSNKNKYAFDTVVCNPPFFSSSLKSPDSGKNIARHDTSLNFDDLISGISTVLAHDGNAWLIIPFFNQDMIMKIASENRLHASKTITIFPKAGKIAHRSIIELKRGLTENEKKAAFTIRDINGNYTAEYRQKTENYYVSF